MKYFSPVSKAGTQISETRRSSRTPQGTTDDAMEFPPTAAASEDSQIPDTMPTTHTQIVVPVQKPEPNKQLVGVIESHPDSCISGITIPITDTLVSFGRGPANTEPFSDIYESRVPKYAFKILLWKDGDTFDPSKIHQRCLSLGFEMRRIQMTTASMSRRKHLSASASTVTSLPQPMLRTTVGLLITGLASTMVTR
ncbi:hypothetical protein NXS19_000525 [Fusarium pseudograminearum]|nr:hypothetical protein NXS19_000525 [Fusarium pseudograminearum]